MNLGNMTKRAADNLPGNISVPYDLLHDKSGPLYINITKPNNGLYLFKESNVPLFLCKKR